MDNQEIKTHIAEAVSKGVERDPGLSHRLLIDGFRRKNQEKFTAMIDADEWDSDIEKLAQLREQCKKTMLALLDPEFEHEDFSDVSESIVADKDVLPSRQSRRVRLDDEYSLELGRQFYGEDREGQAVDEGQHSITAISSSGQQDIQVVLNFDMDFRQPNASPSDIEKWKEDLDTLTRLAENFGVEIPDVSRN